MQVRLLGGVRVASDDGVPVEVGPAKCQTVLAALALSAGAVVPVSRLIELVWGETAPRTAEKSLQTYIVRLRKSLGADAIVRSGAAYGLAVEADSVDVVRFQRHLTAGDVSAALEEWTGAPLAGLDPGGLQATVEGLVEQWLSAVEVDLEGLVETDASGAIGSLTELTASYPLREGLWALLMTALYGVGRQADALAAYRKAREHLVEQLGVEPGRRLRELEALILDHDEKLSVRSPSVTDATTAPTGTVTFGFSDIEGSARLLAGDRQRTAQAVARHDELARAAATNHDGHVFSSGGDSFGVAFHRASDAIDWAADLQVAISDEHWPTNVVLRVRVGIHTGEAEERGNGYFGPAVNVASRIASVGHGGQTLVSGALAGLLDGEELHDLGVLRFDDVGTDHQILQVGQGDHPPLQRGRPGQGNLPRRFGRLIGRDEILGAAATALRAAPLVTFVGPGGIGKTRLALAAARTAELDLPGGVWLIELADVASQEGVARAVAQVLDAKERSDRSLTWSILETLNTSEALLVLDNCEHVIDGAAELARAIVGYCPAVTILATSREGLGVDGEQLIPVGPLDAAGAGVELFNERAIAADPSFDAQASRNEVEEICRRLDGLPLAIELAAARVRSLSPTHLVTRLDDHLRLLTGGRRRTVERHRTLRATISWSHDLLSSPEQVLFQRLSIFAGSFDLEGAETVASDAALDATEVDALLGDLVDRSMINVESGPNGRQFRLLETMRQFGAEQLADAGNSDTIAERHANYVRDQIKDIGQLLAGQSEVKGVSRLNALWPNLRAAIDWACATGDLELATSLVDPIAAQVFLRRGTSEIGDWAERILTIIPGDDEDSIAQCLFWAGLRYSLTRDRSAFDRLARRYGDPDHLLARYSRYALEERGEEALAVAPSTIGELRRRGGEQLATLLEIFLVGYLQGAGRLDEAEARVEALTERFRADGPPTFLNWTLYMQAAHAAFRGDHQRADELYERCASIHLPVRTNSPNEVLEARTAFRAGEHPRAFQILRSYVNELLEVDNMQSAALVCVEFINMMTEIDRLPEAGRILGHLDTTGLLGIGPGFNRLIANAADAVATHPGATIARTDAVEQGLDERSALVYMRDVFEQLLSPRPTGQPS